MRKMEKWGHLCCKGTFLVLVHILWFILICVNLAVFFIQQMLILFLTWLDRGKCTCLIRYYTLIGILWFIHCNYVKCHGYCSHMLHTHSLFNRPGTYLSDKLHNIHVYCVYHRIQKLTLTCFKSLNHMTPRKLLVLSISSTYFLLILFLLLYVNGNG